MTEEMKEAILELIANSLEVDLKTTSNYTGGFDGRPLYEDHHTIQLKLDGEVISEVYL
ncbi:hypothetical protein D3C85_474640 [compost metagenome]